MFCRHDGEFVDQPANQCFVNFNPSQPNSSMVARAALAELEVRHLHCIESADFGLRHIRPEPVPSRWCERVQSGTT